MHYYTCFRNGRWRVEWKDMTGGLTPTDLRQMHELKRSEFRFSSLEFAARVSWHLSWWTFDLRVCLLERCKWKMSRWSINTHKWKKWLYSWICCRSLARWWDQEVLHSWLTPPAMSLFVLTSADAAIEQLVWRWRTTGWVTTEDLLGVSQDCVTLIFSLLRARAGGYWQRAAPPGTSTLRRCWAARFWSSAVILTTTRPRATEPNAFLLTFWRMISVSSKQVLNTPTQQPVGL